MAGPLLYHGRALAADPDRKPDALFLPGHRGVPEPGWLADAGQRKPRSRLVRYAGPSVVAGWRGVGRATVSHWLRRHGDCPPEDARLITRPGGGYDRYWADTGASRRAWQEWDESRKGRGGKGVPRPGSGNAARAGVSVPALIGAAALPGVTAGFGWSAPVTGPNLKVLAAMDAAGGRLLVTGKGTCRVVWANTQADADAASGAMPALVFAPAR